MGDARASEEDEPAACFASACAYYAVSAELQLRFGSNSNMFAGQRRNSSREERTTSIRTLGIEMSAWA